MATRKRKKYFVDSKVQGTLVVRVLIYWITFLACVFFLSAVVPIIVCTFGLPITLSLSELLMSTWINFLPALIASAIVLPFVIVDSIRWSNRFAGPVFRLRAAMKRLANGESVKPVKFREKDFWFEFSEDFNRVLRKIQKEHCAATTDVEPKESLESTSA